MKRCEVCGKVKPEEEFSKSYKGRCKACVSAMAKYKRNLGKEAQRMKTLYETPNPEIDAEIEKLLNPIDWEQRRYELTKVAMQSIISNPVTFELMQKPKHIGTNEMISLNAVGVADEIIKRLKGGK